MTQETPLDGKGTLVTGNRPLSQIRIRNMSSFDESQIQVSPGQSSSSKTEVMMKQFL